MLTKTQMTLIIIAVVIIILFAIAYFVLFRLAFLSRIKLVKNGLEDDKVVKHLTKKYKKYIKRHDPRDFIQDYKAKHTNSVAFTVAVNVLVGIVTIFCVSIISIGLYFRLNNQQMFVNGKTLLVVETGSMSYKHDDNKYLSDNNLNNQFKARALIEVEQIDKTKELELYGVYAFWMDGKVIIHRLVEIKHDKNTNQVTYRFQGDANPLSLYGETNVKIDKVIGKYTGYNNVLLGTTVLFVQSGIGMIAILVSLIIYALYSAYYDKDTQAFEDRCFAYLDMMYPKFHQEHPVYTVYDGTLVIPSAIFTDDSTEEVVDLVDFEAPVIDVVDDKPTIEEIPYDPFANIKSLTYPEKMINNESLVRNYYNEIKSYLLSYKQISNRISNQYETFKLGYNKLFLLEIRGTKLKLNINVPVGLFDDKYHLKENTTKKLEDYPVGLKITSDRALKYSKEIIDIVLHDYELVHNYEYKDYMTMLLLEYDKTLTKRYSFDARISLADDVVRNNYNSLKNMLLNYKGVKSRVSQKGDTFSYKTNKFFMIELRGQTLRLHINDKIDDYPDKYHLKENKNKKAINYPIFLKVRSQRSLKYAKEIIDKYLLGKEFIYNVQEVDYLLQYPKRTEIELITIGEIKIRKKE